MAVCLHQLLNHVNGVNVVHGILNNPPDLLETLVGTHYRHRVAVYEDVCLCEKLESLECCAVLSENSLAPLDESLLVPYHAADLDDVAGHAVFENLDRLGGWY